MPAQALYLKWRPQTFDDVIGQDHITRTLRNALRQDRIRHAYLFSGPRGTGKTTTARLLAKAVNCQDPDPDHRPCNHCGPCVAVNEGRLMDLIEIDAASHTGVDDVRDLRDKIGFSPSEGRFKVYIIDEVHRFSGAAFDALLKTLEEPPEHAIFVLATTEIAKVPATIKSRCLMFEFRRVALAEVADRLELIAASEGVVIERDALELIAREGTGSVRDSISLLDQLIADPDQHISLEYAERALGTTSGQNVVELVDALIAGDAASGLDIINDAVDGGADPRQFGRQVVDYLRQLMLLQMAGDDLVDATAERLSVLHTQAGAIRRGAVLVALRAFNAAVAEWQSGWQPQLPLEMAYLDSLRQVFELDAEPELALRAASRPPVRAAAPVPDAVPPVVSPAASQPEPAAEAPVTAHLGTVRAEWSQIQRSARTHHPSLPALLDHATPRDIREDVLVLGVNVDIFKQKLEDPPTRQALEESLHEVLGVALRVQVIVVDETQHSGQHDDLLAQDDVLAFGVNELGGELTDLDE